MYDNKCVSGKWCHISFAEELWHKCLSLDNVNIFPLEVVNCVSHIAKTIPPTNLVSHAHCKKSWEGGKHKKYTNIFLGEMSKRMSTECYFRLMSTRPSIYITFRYQSKRLGHTTVECLAQAPRDMLPPAMQHFPQPRKTDQLFSTCQTNHLARVLVKHFSLGRPGSRGNCHKSALGLTCPTWAGWWSIVVRM